MIQSIRIQATKLQTDMQPGQLIVYLATVPFYALGWLVGFLWRMTLRIALWFVAAVVAGFKDGKGN